jgi:hypothetical protein
MLEQILAFITPGPLTEIFGFRLRVFTSWITLGLALGLILCIGSLSSGTVTIDGTLLMNYLLQVPFIVCFLGMVGLGIDAISGRRSEYPGWYWWLFPIVTYIIIGISLAFGMIALIFGINLPSPRINSGRRPIENERKKKIRKEIQKKQAKEFLEEYEQLLEQIPLVQHPSREGILFKLRNAPPGAQLEDILTEEEFQEMIMMFIEQYAN